MMGKIGLKYVTSSYIVSQLSEKRYWTKGICELQLKANFKISKTILILNLKAVTGVLVLIRIVVLSWQCISSKYLSVQSQQ